MKRFHIDLSEEEAEADRAERRYSLIVDIVLGLILLVSLAMLAHALWGSL